ncbi:unnamed protein product [Cladocopium goreaui]|nr:unnamed protein product [Cladocopium goreaui]
MLEEFRQRIRRSVSAEWDHFLHQGEEVFVAESALDTCDWDPRRAFLFARDLAIAVKKTRHLASQAVSHPSFSNQRFPIDAVVAALTVAKLQPKVALAVLFGEPPNWPAPAAGYAAPEAEEDSTCCIV